MRDESIVTPISFKATGELDYRANNVNTRRVVDGS